ncbi:MAG: glutathione S-transferase family protein [Kiloniellales bacterium]
MSDAVVLIGPSYSVYVRIARLALIEKGVPYHLEEFDIFDDAAIPPDYRERHPFKRVPLLRHDDFELYETSAITRYVDEAFAGPPLQPSEPRQRARLNQVIALLDSYAYWPLVRVIYVQRRDRDKADEAAIAEALPQAKRCLGALERLLDPAGFFSGPAFGLADIHAIPIFAYFLLTAEGRGMIAQHPALAAWWSRMRERPSVAATRFAAEAPQ